jgi:hypothetical protein
MPRTATDTVQFKLRMREDLRQRLEDAARARKISLNAAIVERLDASFFFAETAETMGRSDLFMVIHLLAAAIKRIENMRNKKWYENPDTLRETGDLIRRMFEQFAELRSGNAYDAQPPVSFGELMADLFVSGLARAAADVEGEDK